MYSTYSIIDPVTKHFVYVGQTNNFERRKTEHLKPPRTRTTRHPKGSIKAWLAQAHRAGIVPIFIILEIVETEEQSLLSESNWVEKLAQANQPLLNRWEEHQALIEAGRAGDSPEHYRAYRPDKWKEPIAHVEPTPKKAGYELTILKKIELLAGQRLIILPKREGDK